VFEETQDNDESQSGVLETETNNSELKRKERIKLYLAEKKQAKKQRQKLRDFERRTMEARNNAQAIA